MTETGKNKVTEPIKRRVRVTLEYDVDITLMPSMFGPMTLAEFLAEWEKYFGEAADIDGIAKYAAHMAVTGGRDEDGIGTLSPNYLNADTNVKYDIDYEAVDLEIIREVV